MKPTISNEGGAEASLRSRVIESVAGLFALLSTPIRLKIIAALCEGGEKNVSALLQEIPSTQPNLSQHLRILERAGVLDRRRDGAQIHYAIRSERVVLLCRAVCDQIESELRGEARIARADRLLPNRHA